MKYKKSRFNVEIDHLNDGRILLYNTYSGILGIMDTQTQKIYEHLEDLSMLDLEDAEMKCNFDTLVKFGYIVAADIDELAAYKLERANMRARSQVLSLTIAPTMACNMRCPYCYENKNNKTMSKETREMLVEFVRAHFEAQPELKLMSVTWYGGEPLLQKKTIYELSDAFIAICDEHNTNYNAMIVTNGALLDKETAWKLYDRCKVRKAQITIDGMPDLHNTRRIFADGTGSFDLIINNIDECRSFLPIHIRMNIDKSNVAEAEKFLDFATTQKKWCGNPNIYLAAVDSYTESCAHTASMCLGGLEFAEVKRHFQELNYAINPDNVRGEFFPRRIWLHCGAEWQYNYVIDPEGYYCTCWMLIGDEAYRCGHIEKPFAVTTEYYKWLSSEIPEKCNDCEYLPMCAGGCGYFRMIREGEPNCAGKYYSYKDTLRLAYRDYIQSKPTSSEHDE